MNPVRPASADAIPVHDAGAWRGAAALTVLTIGVFGFGYSMVGVGLGQALFPIQANGSLVERNGQVAGSRLIAQSFDSARYFHPRPSAAGHDPMAAAGSNMARSNPELRERLAQARESAARRDEVDLAHVPGDLVTQSGSGLDPHLSPEGALVQVERVARARGLPPATVAEQVARHTERPQLGLLGTSRINVLALNLALDARQPR